MCFSEKRVTLIDLRYVLKKTECQFDPVLCSVSSFSPVYSWFLASNPKTSRTNLRDVSASALLCWCLDTSAYRSSLWWCIQKGAYGALSDVSVQWTARRAMVPAFWYGLPLQSPQWDRHLWDRFFPFRYRTCGSSQWPLGLHRRRRACRAWGPRWKPGSLKYGHCTQK